MRPPTLPPPPASAAARIVALADQCVLCGLCLPQCPTYRLERSEGESPRGRIMLWKGLAEGRLEPERTTLDHLDHCLACRHCERVCPANVAYGELLLAGRSLQREAVGAGWRQRLLEWLLPRPLPRALALRTASWLRRIVPGPWRALPATPRRRRLRTLRGATHVASRGRVALFAGCLGEHHDAATVAAATRVLAALGWDVVVPSAQTCCGTLHRHAGATSGADALAARNHTAFAASTASVTLTLASGCHEAIAASVGGVDHAVHDLLAFVAADARLPTLALHAATTPVALHLPCTQRNVVRSHAATEALLRRIPGLVLQRLADDGCCGAAGNRLLLDPARAASFRAPLLDAFAASGATTLLSANVGCRLHLAAGSDARTPRVVHPITYFAEHLA